MPVGNDVVDIRHPLCQPDAIHPRFDTRAFTAREIALLAATEKAHQMRWSLWAAKESAFKALRKLDSQVRFIPRDFEVILGEARTEVTHQLARFSVWIDHSDQWVHAVASQAGEKPRFRLNGDSSANPGSEEEGLGDQVARLSGSGLGGLLDIAPSEIEIVSVNRIPQAQRQGQPLPFDLSLSHDGRFVSCAWESV